MARFNRVYRLQVGRAGSQGFEITAPIRIQFEIEKDAGEQPNANKVRLYNLAPATRNRIEQPDLRCLLYAGYAEEDGAILIAAGTITAAQTRCDGSDVVTELEIHDGYVEIRDTAVTLGYGPGVSATAIIRELARLMGLPLIMAQDVPDRTWQNGFSFYGPARQALHKVVQGTGLEWSIQNQTLQVVPKRGTTRRQAVVLAADSGLLGYPQRSRAASSEKDKASNGPTGTRPNLVSAAQQRDGWHVQSLLLPQINPGDLVKLESRSANGFYRADSVRHTGDTDDEQWQTHLQLVEPTASQKTKR
jgi:hypothetical protein